MPETMPDSPPAAPGQMPASSFDIQAPYAPAPPSGIFVGGDADPGGRDDVAGTVAGAIASAEARYAEHMSDTLGQGGQVGDLVGLPDVVSDHSLMTGGDGIGSTPFEEGS